MFGTIGVIMKKIKSLIPATICLLLASLSFAYAGPIRIMPLGDSITRGSSVSMQDNNYIVGYRQDLYLNLINGGYDVDFVGSMNSGSLARPVFDINHEGHSGWCADGCVSTMGDILDNVYTFLTNNPADVVLLHIGTNDISAGHENAAEVGAILDEIYRRNPDIIVVLARIINRTDTESRRLRTTQYNSALGALAENRAEYGNTLYLVDMEYALNYSSDMDDALHPNATGYAKMADVWLTELEPLLSRQLIVQKTGTGDGTITSSPVAIDCGNTCSVSLPYGTIISLTATADYGNAFLEWTGCDSVVGNKCTVTLESDRTVTAAFRLVGEVTFLSPKRGETIQAGSVYAIRWEAPPDATTFKLSAYPWGIIGTTSLAHEIMWEVPIVKRNKTRSRVKITAYDDNGKKIGSATTEDFFTIEGVRITFPNVEGDTCVGGETCTITWVKSEYVPAESARIFYKLRNNGLWKEIPESISGDAGSFTWVTPVVSEPQTKCKVKIVLKDSNGKTVGSDKSDGVFTIQPAP